MRNRRRQTRSAVEGLRLAIDCLPVATREAMLEGVQANERIIVGAYVDGWAASARCSPPTAAGARTDFLSFAKSWDRFARVRGRRARRPPSASCGSSSPSCRPACRSRAGSSSTARSPSTAS